MHTRRDFAREVTKLLRDAGLHAELSDAAETLPKRVRQAQVSQINYIVVIGDKEVEQRALSVRTRDDNVVDENLVKPEEFRDMLLLQQKAPAPTKSL